MLVSVLTAIITLGCLQSNSKLDFENPRTIELYYSSQVKKKTISSTDPEYAVIIKHYNQSFKKSYLNQILSEDYIGEYLEEDTTAKEWSPYNFDEGLFIKFTFEKNQKLILTRNGATRQLFIDGIIMQLSQKDKVQKTYIYYSVGESYNNDPTKTGDSEIFYPLVVSANTSKLYNYVEGMQNEE